MYSTYSSTMDWFVVSHGKPWETDGLRPCTGPAVPGALQGEILCEFQVLEAWDTGHKKSPGELALFSSNMAILLVLNVGNGWVAGVAGIINSYCGSFPKIPYV